MITDVPVIEYVQGSRLELILLIHFTISLLLVEIQKSPRCSLVESREWAVAKIWSFSAHGF